MPKIQLLKTSLLMKLHVQLVICSPLFRFHFWQPVFFNSDYSMFPSDSIEETGRFAGISDDVVHNITFTILITTINKIISRPNVRQVGEPISPNLTNDPLTASEFVTSLHPPTNYL